MAEINKDVSSLAALMHEIFRCYATLGAITTQHPSKKDMSYGRPGITALVTHTFHLRDDFAGPNDTQRRSMRVIKIS